MISNVAVVAASLADEGERVMVLDYDAHHGNGTQAVFYDDPRVLFVSYHQWPLYPGTGRIDETGADAGAGTTLNIPLPAGTTGDVYLRAFDEIVAPVAERFAPTWVIVSAGFDAAPRRPADRHRARRRRLRAADGARAFAWCPPAAPGDARRRIRPRRADELLWRGHASAGGGSGAWLAANGSSNGAEGPTSAGPGSDAVDAVARHWQQQGWL